MPLLHAPEHTAPSSLFGRKPTQVELISEPRPPHRTDIHRVRRMVQGVAAGLRGLVRRARVRSGGLLARVGFHQPEKHARAIELGILAELKTPNDAAGERAAVQDLALRFAVTIHIHVLIWRTSLKFRTFGCSGLISTTALPWHMGFCFNVPIAPVKNRSARRTKLPIRA